MSGISLETIIQFIIDDLPTMIKQQDNTSRFSLKIQGNKNITNVRIELQKNPIKETYHDASIVIDTLSHMVKNVEHQVKLTIYSRQCLKNGKLNNKSPDRELGIDTIIPTKGKSFLQFPEIAEIENELSSNVCSTWHDLLLN